MRILKIELQNINSLKSKAPIVIDFESAHFKDVGLYAITGSTGAGKTTILDAITIALYHSVPRFNSTTAKANLHDVVSYGANEAMARVSFENQGKRYEAHWSMRLTTAAGKPLTNPKEEVRLKDLSTGKIIAEKKMNVKAEVERVTQLSYHQFLRSAMLAQGEFAAFLSASSQDKGKLLEQITGEGIYKKIGETIGTKIAEERGTLEKIRAKINGEDLLTAEQDQELKAEQEVLKKGLEKLSDALKTVELISKWYQKKTELDKEQEQLAQSTRTLEEERQSHQATIARLKLHEKAEPHKELLDTIKRLEKEQAESKGQIQQLDDALKHLATEIAEAQKQEEKGKAEYLQSEDTFKDWLPKLDRVGKLDASIQNGREKKEEKQKLAEENKAQITLLQSAFEEIQKKQEEEGQKLEKTEAFLGEQKDCLQLEKQLTQWHSDLSFRQRNHEKIQLDNKIILKQERVLTHTQRTLKETADQHDLQQNKLGELNTILEKTVQQLEAKPVAGILLQREKLDKKIIAWKEALRLSVESKSLNETKKTLTASQQVLAEQQDQASKQDKDLKGKIKIAESALKDAEKILELERQILRFDDERKKLTEGAPCSLCGSTEHPYVSQYENATLSKSQALLEERKSALEALTNEETKTALSLVTIKTKTEANASQLKTLDEQLKTIAEKFDSLNISRVIEASEDIQDTVTEMDKQSAALSGQISEGQALQKTKDAQDTACKTQTTLVNELKTKQATLSEKQQNTHRELKQKQGEFAQLNLETKDLETQLRDDLSPYKLGLPSVEESAAFIRSIEQRITTYHAKTKEQQELKNQLTQGAKDIKNNREQFSEKQKIQSGLEKDQKEIERSLLRIIAERKDLLPLEVSILEKRETLQNAKDATKKALDLATQCLQKSTTAHVSKAKEIENFKEAQVKSQHQLSSANLDFEKAIVTSDFETREAVEQALLSLEDKTHAVKTIKSIEDKDIALKTLEKRLNIDIAQLEKGKDFEASAEEATQQQQTLEKEKTTLTERTGEIRQKFELDRQIKERNQAVTQEITTQEKVLKKWTVLITLLGGSKHAFNTYVQRLTLHNLIQLANVHLFKLNKRYSLRLDANYKPGEELFFKLIDHYQTNEARYVDTSSGGEKFLISLALALGLSDLASSNVSIDSLFIDEGFGTLDSHTLETVISSLETLQAQGKMIGIISHVENMKERIPTQIQVYKKSNGVSEVTIA